MSNLFISEERKIRKPLMEKKRRARINESLETLKNILLECDPDSVNRSNTKSAKLEKADILEMTVSYLQRLKARQKVGFHPYANPAHFPNKVHPHVDPQAYARMCQPLVHPMYPHLRRAPMINPTPFALMATRNLSQYPVNYTTPKMEIKPPKPEMFSPPSSPNSSNEVLNSCGASYRRQLKVEMVSPISSSSCFPSSPSSCNGENHVSSSSPSCDVDVEEDVWRPW